MNKRGLSNVITTVLIILLVLAAVIIIWVFLRPVLFNVGGQVESGLLTSNFEIKKDAVYLNETKKEVNLTIKRNPGVANNVTSVLIILEDTQKNQKTFRFNYTAEIKELETKKISVDYSLSGLNALAKIHVTPIVLNKDGRELKAPIKDSYIIRGTEPSAQTGNGGNQVCGNNIIEIGEICDGNSQSCTINGYSGTQQCNSQCSGFGSCISSQSCGDGVINGDEQCDGNDFGGVSCQSFGFTIGTLSCTSSCIIDSGGCAVSSNGLIAYWKFDESNGATAFDSSGNGNNGNLVNGPSWVIGKFGNAVSLNGMNQYVNIPASSSLNSEWNITVSMWFYLNVISNNYYVLIAQRGPSCSPTINWQLYAVANPEPECSGNKMFWDGVCSSQSTPIGSWTHVVAVVNGTSHLLYVNGILSNSGNVLPSPRNLLIPTIIGDESCSNYFNGLIDETAIWNRTLSAQEIQELYSYYNS